MTNVGGSFGSAVLLASGGFAGGDIAVDGANHVHVIFSQLSSNGYHVFYTNNSGGSFQPATNLTASYPTYSNQSPRIALDTDNNVHLVMHSLATGGAPVFDPDLAEIFYINNIGGSFPSTTPTQITSNSGNPDGARQRNARLAIDGMDVIHIIFGTSFYNPYPTTDHKELTYMENSTGVFTSTLAVYDVYDYELAVNSAGNAFIAYRDPSNNDLYVTDNRTGTFVADVVSSQSGTFEAEPDIVVDGEAVHIAWNRLASPEADVLYANNHRSQPPTGECFVQNIEMSLTYKGNGKPSRQGWTATATILIYDDQAKPVQGATVLGHWSGLTSDNDNGTTGSDGEVALDSDRINATGTFTFTVDNVTHSSLTYNPNLNLATSNSISNLSKAGKAPTESGNQTSIPSEFQLFQNHPNPFNPETTIRFALPEASHVEITIYNTRGQIIHRLVSQNYPVGEHAMKWDGQNDLGADVASGTYLYKIQAGEFTATRKMALVR